MDSSQLALKARSIEQSDDGTYRQIEQDLIWEPQRTAAVICDMWDTHWCRSASGRVAEMAPRMNELVRALRALGVSIIHAPSDTLDFYAAQPGRRMMQLYKSGPEKDPLPPIRQIQEGALPIDDSDGGCDCTPPCRIDTPWTRQIGTIEILAGDGITDSDEIFHCFLARGIRHVLVMGVHTNMCILGRPFAIRELVKRNLDVVLVRDMTDTMYNPARLPRVDHFTGTDLVVWHIERYLCPTVSSDQVIGGSPFRFRADTRAELPAFPGAVRPATEG